jgi:hypothetical protein
MRTRLQTNIAALLICGLTCLLTGQATAADTLLIYGPGMPGADAEADARDQAAPLLRGGQRRADAIHVSEVPFLGPAPMWAAGDVVVRPCGGGLRELSEIRGLVERGVEQTDLLEEEQAAKTFRSAWLALECAGGFVPRDLLYEIHFYSGLSAYVAGDEERAGDHFLEAVSTDPGREFDPGYPPEIEKVYRQAERRWADADVLVMEVRDPQLVAIEVRVDGQPVRAGTDRWQLSPGIHLVQFSSRFGTFTSLRVEAEEGGQAVLLSREGLVDALLAPDADATAEAAAATALRQLAADRGVTNVVGSILGERPLLYRWESMNDSFAMRDPVVLERTTRVEPVEPVEEDPVEVTPRDGVSTASSQDDPVEETEVERVKPPPQHGALVASFGWFYYPTESPDPAASSYANLGVLFEWTLREVLAADFGFWVPVRAPQTPGNGVQETEKLPTIRLGLRVNLAPWPVRPYVGGALHLVLEDGDGDPSTEADNVIHTGGVGIVGLNIDPGKHLRIQLDAQMGFGQAFILQTTAGVGVRF